MENKTSVTYENVKRMNEIAQIYEATRQSKKSERYHRAIIRLCDKHPKNEKLLQYKIHSLNQLNKSYKSLEATKELLNLNPNNPIALLNVIRYLKEASYV
jgi:predicted Zn-dependent protease